MDHLHRHFVYEGGLWFINDKGAKRPTLMGEASLLKVALLDAAANCYGIAKIDGIGDRSNSIIVDGRVFYHLTLK